MDGHEAAREVALPAAALGALRKTLWKEAGPLAAIHSLHTAGYEAGESMYAAFTSTLREPLENMGERRFWTALSQFLSARGWGSVVHSTPHPGVGLLTSADWAESGAGREAQPTCAFSAGLISSLLTRAAMAPVAVLEVSCRARGNDACGFAFGSEATIHDLYGSLLDGNDLQQALAEL